MTNIKITTKDMVLCGIFAAIICICSVINIPIGVIPVTLAPFGIMLACSTLGVRKGMLSTIVYILIGAVGIPVFAGFKGGISVLTGPTGGYIIGYVFLAFASGLGAREFKLGKLANIIISILCNIFGLALCYLFGTIQFLFITKADLAYAMSVCVIPFIGFDIIKAVCASIPAYAIRKAVFADKK